MVPRSILEHIVGFNCMYNKIQHLKRIIILLFPPPDEEESFNLYITNQVIMPLHQHQPKPNIASLPQVYSYKYKRCIHYSEHNIVGPQKNSEVTTTLILTTLILTTTLILIINTTASYKNLKHRNFVVSETIITLLYHTTIWSIITFVSMMEKNFEVIQDGRYITSYKMYY